MSPITLSDLEQRALPTMLEFAAIECLSPAYDHQWQEHGQIARAAALLRAWAAERKLARFDVQLHEIAGRTPVLTITVEATADVAGTVVLYGHMDKQPPLGEWSEGLHPFRPVRRDDRLYARGLADDGYAIFSALLALEDLEARGVPHARCVVLIEASEESGSPDLDAHLTALADHLGDVQLLLCLDSGALTYDRLWVTTSLRGNVIIEVTAHVLEHGVHSGVASGVVPSSFRVLRMLLERIEETATGRIQLSELYAEIPEAHRRAAELVTTEFGDVAGDEQPKVQDLELLGASPAERLLRRTWWPTLSVTGVDGIPPADIAGNVLRPFTTLVISLRLPPTVDAETAAQVVRRTLLESPPYGARIEATIKSAGDGWCAAELAPWLESALVAASASAFDRPPAFAGEGGSIPFLAVLEQRYPGVQFVATGVLGPGSNAHGIDEMLDLNFMVGVTNAVGEIIAAHAAQ